MKTFVPVCQSLTGVTSGMLKVAQRLHILKLDDVSAYVKANIERKKLKGLCKCKGPNATLDVLFHILKEKGIYNSDSDSDDDAMSDSE